MEFLRSASPRYHGIQPSAPRSPALLAGIASGFGPIAPTYRSSGNVAAPMRTSARRSWLTFDTTPSYMTAPASCAPAGCAPVIDPTAASTDACAIDPCAECPMETTQIVIL